MKIFDDGRIDASAGSSDSPAALIGDVDDCDAVDCCRSGLMRKSMR
jgi:hypothetical protein